MATFEATRSQFTQEHFEVLEIDLPVITGACTVGSSQGFGTPLTCDQAWADEYKTYKFTNTNAPLLKAPSIYRQITSINENTTEIKPGNGLSARGSLSITFNDFIGDPNEDAPGVTDAVKSQGTFFGKLSARQILENKQVRLKLYRVESDGSIDLVNGAETHHYVIDSLSQNNNGTWKLSCKDVLSLANLEEKTWPPTNNSYLRLDIDETTTSIPVDSETDYSGVFAVRVGDEFMQIDSVTNNLAPGTVLNVLGRNLSGNFIDAPVSGERLTVTVPSSHSAGDEVFLCDLSDNETIDSLLTRVLTDSGLDASLIPSAEWANEVNEWHQFDKINTLHSESEDVNDVLQRILTGYLMDLWFDQISNEVKLSAISAWKESTTTVTEGREIDSYKLKKTALENLRASRALVLFDKQYLANDDSTPSYKKASQFSNPTLISEALYKEHKDKVFENNFLIDSDAADLLTQRYVSRFGYMPFNYSWTTQERFLTFKTGDVVNVQSPNIQSPSGLPSGDLRTQITKVTPKYTSNGRMYDVKSVSYEAAFGDNSEIVLNSPLSEINLHVLAGAPSQAITITFVLDGTYSQGQTAIRAGNFAAGSKIILILANGFDGQANGGKGGDGGGGFYEAETETWYTIPLPEDGEDGGVVYDAEGVDTDIYFSGATPSTAYPVADGYIRAPSGGAGGFDATNADPFVAGDGGAGGDGRVYGAGGDAGYIDPYVGNPPTTEGTAGTNGTINGSTTGWGVAGADNSTTGGAAGSGVFDNGATVVFFGSDASRYINGNGDH